ncbi:13015_t:CDS:2 [Dentiscutata heterogama]|uniref:13015_t:CDS:1 n=1 Tax=Dentiscutata heterogama TaxID=1316150 RepID=A0ACA9MCN3_9GLOM|nr:13015_t:CDS:2 [Dentiscutata heterogama]
MTLKIVRVKLYDFFQLMVRYLHKNSRCGTTSSLNSNWISSSAYISMQKYRPIAYIGGMTLIAFVSVWIFMQKHISELSKNAKYGGFSPIHRERVTSTIRRKKVTSQNTSRRCEVKNVINNVQNRISITLNKIRSIQIDDVTCDYDDLMNVESPSSLFLNAAFETVEQDRYDQDVCLATKLEKQIELENDVEFILNMIKGSKDSYSNGESCWISNNYSTIPVNINDSQKSGKKVVTFATLASDIEQASQRRIMRDFEILKVLKQKKITEEITEGSLKSAIEIVKTQSSARARSTRRLKRPHKMSYEIDDVNKKFLYIDSWKKDMIDRLNDLECEFNALEEMIDDNRILTESFEAKKNKDGEG